MKYELSDTGKRWSGRMWWALGIGLSGVFAGGCGGNESEVRHPPLLTQSAEVKNAPPMTSVSVHVSPGIRPPPTCAELGIPNEPDRVFEHEGKYCGCHDGKAHCRDTNDKCFHEGVWFEKGALISTPVTDCKCVNSPSWMCADYRIPCPQIEILFSFQFELQSTRLPANAPVRFEQIVEALRGQPSKAVFLTAQADPKEIEPTKIAQARAEIIKAELITRGIEQQRIVIDNVGTRPLPIPASFHLKPCTDRGPLNATSRVTYGVADKAEVSGQTH